MSATTILDAHGRPARLDARNFYEAGRASYQRSFISAPIRDANLDIDRFSRTEVSRKARYLYKNSPLITGIIERLVTYVVGTGLYPEPETSDLVWNDRSASAFSTWSKYADLNGHQSFQQDQEQIFRAMLIDGECFTLLTYGASGRPRIQLLEAQRVQGETQKADGISLDKYGRPESYRVQIASDKFEQIPAAAIVHHYRQLRPGQTRGISCLASCINTAHDVQDIVGLEKTAVKEASSKTDVIKTASGEIDDADLMRVRTTQTAINSQIGGESASDFAERTDFYRQVFGAETKIMRTGDELQQLISQRPSQAWQGFMEFLTHTICLSLGVPPSILLQIKVGGADTRRDLAAAARVFEQWQSILAGQFQSIYEYVTQAEIDDGRLSGAPGDWRNTEWQTPKAISVDAGREAQQDREDLKMGNLTWREYFGRWGQQWRKQLRQKQIEQEYIRALAKAGGFDSPEDIVQLKREMPAPSQTPQPTQSTE